MSIDNCDYCEGYVDTDDDPDFYVEVAGDGRSYDPNIKGLCQTCRELRNTCEGCGNELAEFETTKTCRNCAR